MTHVLKTLLDHAERERDEGLALLRQAENAEAQLRLQAEQLHLYRNEYDARHPARGGRAAPIELLRCHLGFMQRLQQAQTQQLGQLEAVAARVQRQRQAVVALELRVASVRKLLERRGHDQRRASDRLEQRRHDEAAQQRAWRDRAELHAAAG